MNGISKFNLISCKFTAQKLHLKVRQINSQGLYAQNQWEVFGQLLSHIMKMFWYIPIQPQSALKLNTPGLVISTLLKSIPSAPQWDESNGCPFSHIHEPSDAMSERPTNAGAAPEIYKESFCYFLNRFTCKIRILLRFLSDNS